MPTVALAKEDARGEGLIRAALAVGLRVGKGEGVGGDDGASRKDTDTEVVGEREGLGEEEISGEREEDTLNLEEVDDGVGEERGVAPGDFD